ncbi:hypothetical protein QAD02_001378 [Eretmocerus hayati]|uniref:Uncharacterized protein n=1 Tax=Eretmocerus hayati TaxID=131215 RepID=A0ACC2NFU6_9HYME|nr:hypothetical protein QAD02_001378 [Eretmocerus hayati]
MGDSTRKRNLSFSFSVDLDSYMSDNSSDSDAAELQIDVAEVDSLDDAKKQLPVDDTSFINEMEEEIERQLDAKAAKTNLTATNVKNILKHVISNEHVMAMVHKRLTKTDDDIIFEPKLTRAKARELAIAQPDMPWSMTPVKKKSSEVELLIQKEFSDDSSDDEYCPDQEQPSDDENDVDNSVGSDFDSQPSTPATPCDGSNVVEVSKDPDIQYDDEGVFKVPPVIPSTSTEEESIGHRTRSKLSLNETPLEVLEQAFIPPDVTSDMYHWDWEPEDEYIHFLKEIYFQPLPEEGNIEDDPEADPEYNILEDEESDLLDKEEMREDRAVKVTKKELKTLFAEHVSMTSGNAMIPLISVLAEPELPELVNDHQRNLLSVQMSHHVQFLVQQFVMTYKHPKLHHQSLQCKEFLNSLITLSPESNSEFIAQNLFDALRLANDWETKLEDPAFLEEYERHLEAEIELEREYFRTKRKYRPTFHPELVRLMVHSKALMHPHILPLAFPYTSSTLKTYLHSEESLIAIGLEQFIPYVKSLNKKFSRNCDVLADAIREVRKYLLPARDVNGIHHHIKKQKNSKKSNPIKVYFQTGSAPKTKHHILTEYKLLAPISQPIESLPPLWRDFVRDPKVDHPVESVTLRRLAPMPEKNQKSKDMDNDSFFGIHSNDFEYLSMSPQNFSVPDNHELRNPIVNMTRNMPSLMTPQKTETNDSIPTSITKSDESETPHSKTNDIESDFESVENIKTCETDDEKSHTTRLRMTTPRLAKIRSAQNMKLLTQSSYKASTSSSNASYNKDRSLDQNDDDTSSFVKGDNEDEIAELMLASTTIKKGTASRKKTKQARELENLKRLMEAENNINEDERSTKFAASFIQKVHVRLESKDPELFRSILKTFSDYSEKLESQKIGKKKDLFVVETDPLELKHSQVTEKNEENEDRLLVNLYREICEKLHDYPDLCSDFLLFLTPHQATLIDKSTEYTMIMKMKEFVNVTQMYFAKQPSRIAKVMQAIQQMVSDPIITLENAQSIMSTALKGHPLILDMFLQVLPSGKPPDSLFAAHMFENLICPVGPTDKNKIHDADSAELFENIDLPVSTSQDDPYGGDSCKCGCHNVGDDSKPKVTNDHCASCGTRFLNGKIYLQTSEGLRPAKITFPGEEDELENISRVSLKPAEKLIPCPPPRKRRKSSKRDSISEDTNVKSCTNKSSPTKDTEDGEKVTLKARKSSKSPVKSVETKKVNKTPIILVKNKREKKREKTFVKSEPKGDEDANESCLNAESTDFEEEVSNNAHEDYVDIDSYGHKQGEASTDSHDDDTFTSPEKMNMSSTSVEKLDMSSDSDSSTNEDLGANSANTPWTMQEDKILIEEVQKEYSEKTFQTVSDLLKSRTVEQVKERCQYLLSLIEKMS